MPRLLKLRLRTRVRATLTAGFSAEVCILGGQLSQDRQWKDTKVQIKRAGYRIATGRERIGLIRHKPYAL